MGSIMDYRDLIQLIPVNNQSTIIKKDIWKKFSYDNELIKAIFGSEDKVELSRADVFSESNIEKKIIMILMWGYPTGGRGNNIKSILESRCELISLLQSVNGQNLTKVQASSIFADFKKIHGLGISTWSKLLYFFNVSVDSKKCQIFDTRIVDSLNKRQFSELGIQEWKQTNSAYFQYIELVDDLATRLSVLPDQVEVFLFYFNLYFKFDI